MHKFEIELIILEYLKENPYTSVDEIRNYTSIALEKRGVVVGEEEILFVNTMIWDLIVERILTPGKDMENLDLPYLHVSSMSKLDNRINRDMDL